MKSCLQVIGGWLGHSETPIFLSFFLPGVLGHYFLNDCKLSSPWGSNVAPNNDSPSAMLTFCGMGFFPSIHRIVHFCLLSHLSAEHAWTCLKHCGTSTCSCKHEMFLWVYIHKQMHLHFLEISTGLLLLPFDVFVCHFIVKCISLKRCLVTILGREGWTLSIVW